MKKRPTRASSATAEAQPARRQPRHPASAAPPADGAAPWAVPATDDEASAAMRGVDLLAWILRAADDEATPSIEVVDHFMSTVLEQAPLYVSGRAQNHYQAAPESLQPVLPRGVEWSSDIMLRAVQKGRLNHGTDINVVRFDNDLQKRVPLKTQGVVAADEYKKALASGWSVRFLRPQEHAKTLSPLLFLLDEVMGCSTGMNSYWTPKGSQGFAPHFDDVEVFMLQLEGSKRWLVYPPPTDGDVLCRVSSPDYKPEDMPEPTLDVTLRAGELLYLPRGWVHQGITSATEHSLHLTVSAFQNHTVGDLLRRVITNKLDTMCNTDVALRRGLPRHWWNVLGSRVNSKVMGPFAAPLDARCKVERIALIGEIRGLASQLFNELQAKEGIVDKGADLFAIEVLERRQPPPRTASPTADQVAPGHKYRLVAANAARLVINASEVQFHHCGGNSVVCLGPTDIPTVVSFDIDFAPALVRLVSSYPNWVPYEAIFFPASDLADDELNELRAAMLGPLLESRVVEATTA